MSFSDRNRITHQCVINEFIFRMNYDCASGTYEMTIEKLMVTLFTRNRILRDCRIYALFMIRSVAKKARVEFSERERITTRAYLIVDLFGTSNF